MIRKALLHIFLPLLAGLLIYILFRSPDTWLHQALGMNRTLFILPANPFTLFIKFHFPDMCWAYALYSGLLVIVGLNRWISATVALVSLSLFEITQAKGDWYQLDWWDIGYMSLAVLIASLINRK